MDLQQFYEGISRLGWPALFVFGQMRGFWYVKPHVDFILEKLREVTGQLKDANERADRALNVAEGANAIASQSMELVKEGNEVAKGTAETVRQLQVEVARLTRMGGN